ncbi:hypothetical protein LWI28_014084 [Acer negundo]|uniref:Uncharacterized protein n=1 Tax=Acer negundo TaxID=4023 RepID=A0AAD5P5W5_ACENE|nr:hypothetical protein LWI28_014084 [Acer negundo]
MQTAEHVAEIVEDVAEKVEKVAEEVADHLPQGGRLKDAVTLIENVAKETAKDAHLADQFIEKVSLNAKAVKRFVKENQWLAEECRRLLSECSLYEHGREALMEYRGEADERAKEAEIRVHNLEVQSGQVLDDLNFYKHQNQTLGDGVDPYEEHQQDRNLNGSGGKHTSKCICQGKERGAGRIKNLKGRTLKVNYAKPKKKNPPPPVWPKPITFNLFVANLSFEARAKDVKEFFISEGCNIVFAEVFFTIIHEGHLVMALYPLKPRKNPTLPFQLLKGR